MDKLDIVRLIIRGVISWMALPFVVIAILFNILVWAFDEGDIDFEITGFLVYCLSFGLLCNDR